MSFIEKSYLFRRTRNLFNLSEFVIFPVKLSAYKFISSSKCLKMFAEFSFILGQAENNDRF